MKKNKNIPKKNLITLALSPVKIILTQPTNKKEKAQLRFGNQ